MEDNYMATTRNGHELKDMYNPETNTLDILRMVCTPPMCSAICAVTVSVLTEWYAAVWRASCNL